MVIILIYIGYLALWFLLVFLSCVVTWKFSKSKKVMGLVGIIAFLIMYWPAFGDYIPIWWAHKQLCEKEAGFTVYITPEQWAKENPGVLETLIPFQKFTISEDFELGNSRIGMGITISPLNNGSVRRKTVITIDVKTKKILSKNVDFIRGYGGLNNSIKPWLHSYSCYSDTERKEKLLVRKAFLRKLNTIWGQQ